MKKYFISILAVALVFAGSVAVVSQTTVTWEGILPGISSELGGSYAINVAITQTTDGLDVSEETALTNTVNGTITSTHTTSGTPANNIGNGIWFYQMTSTGNTEKVAEINAVMTDVTTTSEDAKLDIELMAAGAASAVKWSLGSTGIVTQVGGATLDNATSATELNITETNIQLSGIIDLEGGAVTVNDDSGDYDFTVETNGNATAIVTDAGNDRVGIFTAAPAVPFDVTGEVHLDGGNVSINQDSGDYDFKVETDSTDNALLIDGGNDTLETNALTVTFNQGSADVDFTIETDDNATAFVVDGGDDTVKVNTGMYFKAVVADPCAGAGFGEGAIFYNDTANVLCFCDGTNDLKIVDGSACF